MFEKTNNSCIYALDVSNCKKFLATGNGYG
jgi:hypothetical protein